MTLSELAALPEAQASVKTIRHRIHRGWDIEDAVRKPPGGKQPQIMVNFRTTQWALIDLANSEFNTCGLCYSSIYNRVVKYGWNIEEALTEPVDSAHNNGNTARIKEDWHRFDYFGKSLTVSELSRLEFCKVNRGTLWQRLVVLKWPLAKALLTPKYPDKGYKERTPNMTKEEREYWDNWLITPLEVILKRCEEHWEAERAGGLPQRKTPGWGRQI